MWVFPVVLLFCVLVGLAGAAAAYYVYSPSRYSDGEIDSYVKSIYGGDWTLHRKQQTALEQEGVASYLYENKDGMHEKGCFGMAFARRNKQPFNNLTKEGVR